MSNLDEYDTDGVEPQRAYDVLPAGKYLVMVTESEVKTTKKGDGKYLGLTLRVIDGEYTNRKFFDRITLNNPNPQAVEIGRRQLSGVRHATGQLQSKDSSAFHDIPIIAVVKVKQDEGHDPSNEVKAYESTSAVSLPPTQQPAVNTAQQQPAANQGFQQPMQQAAGAKSPPWGGK